ncbi:MAG: ComF family protein [Bacteroidales bacterium]
MSCRNKFILLADDFVSLLFPRLCNACGQPLVRNEKLICISCLLDIPETGYHLQRDNLLEKRFYGRCYIEKAAAWSYYRQGSKVQHLIHKLKYNGVRPLGKYLGGIYGNILRNTGFCDDIDCILAVPLHKSRMRKRGFNQSVLIAEGMSYALDIPKVDKVLVRIKRSATQTRKQRYERWENVEGVFSVRRSEQVEGSHVLLVDDVITTGSTIEACAAELLKLPGVKVSVATLATAEK